MNPSPHHIPPRYPTIHEVARACGVAASTVSRAFSSPNRVNATTRARILATAQQMGYRPNPAARALPSGRSHTLALLVADITNPFFFDIIRGAEKAADAAGYTLVLADTDEDAETEARHLARLARAVDGFVLASSRMSDDAYPGSRRTRTAGAHQPAPVATWPRSTIDTHDGMRQAAEHLADLGHRRVAYLGGPASVLVEPPALDRADRGSPSSRASSSPDSARTSRRWTAATSPPTNSPATGATAAIAFNDLVAIGALLRLQEHGIDVPGEMSIVGVGQHRRRRPTADRRSPRCTAWVTPSAGKPSAP